MAQRFVALNVGTGDAFFIEREGFSALVDGGLRRGFSEKFTRTLSRHGVDVLVCTHGDADHASGVLQFLDAGLDAGQCWLPATWLQALDELLNNPTAVISDVLGGDGGDAEKPLPKRIDRDGPEIGAEAIDEALEREAARDPVFDRLDGHIAIPAPLGHTIRVIYASRQRLELLVDSSRIRQIALAATRRQIPIRWFDPAVKRTGPAHPHLDVVNAADVRTIRRAKVSPGVIMRLTQINRDSLVLYSPESDTAPGVLFSGDSGFANEGFPDKLSASPNMIVTAPHHGAADAENLEAYEHLAGEHGPLQGTWTWVRSDRAMKVGGSRPCGSYLKKASRYCTNCRGAARADGQDLAFDGSDGRWIPAAGLRPCSCSG